MTRKSFVLHVDSLDVLDELTNEQAGMLFKAMRSFHIDDVAENDNVSKNVNVNDSDNKNDSKSVSVIKEKDLSPKVNANLFLIDEIFQYWVRVMNKSPRTSLTSLRKSKIDSRLKDGYPSHEIKQAIDNVAKDSFLVAGGHTDIEMICRSDTNLEKYRDAMPISKADIKMSKHNQDIEEFSRGTQP